MNIFSPQPNGSSRGGIITQQDRNDFVNTYSAKVRFPKAFKNVDYMVFSN